MNARGRIDVDLPAFGASAGPARPPQRNAVLPIVQSRSKPHVLHTADLAAALQDGEAPVPRKSRLRRAFVMLIFAGLIGGIVLLYKRPDLRDRSQQWLATNYAAARQRLGAMLAQHQAPAAANSNDVDNLLPADSGDVGAPRPVAAPVAQRPVEDSWSSHPSGDANIPAADSQSAPAPIPAPVVPKPVPVVVTPVPAPSNQPVVAGDLDRSRILYDRAIDAESRNDWSQAVRYYEAIQRLPHAAWEADLTPRLNYARKMAGMQ
jgi:hypothetical protein